ncbi:MAG: hypothetical protein AAF437_06535 [Pseudomonadota bacterium]
MTRVQELMIGLLMIALGGLKTWLHMGTIPMLALPTCTGETVFIAASRSSWFEQAHCWGCYMFVAGMLVAMHAGYRYIQKRRSVALIMD